MNPAAAQRDRQRPPPDEIGAQSEFVDQLDGMTIAAEQVMVELVEPDAGFDLEAGGEAAGQRLALDDDDGPAALRKAPRNRQPEGSGP
jgi:hypothetical protein